MRIRRELGISDVKIGMLCLTPFCSLSESQTLGNNQHGLEGPFNLVKIFRNRKVTSYNNNKRILGVRNTPNEV